MRSIENQKPSLTPRSHEGRSRKPKVESRCGAVVLGSAISVSGALSVAGASPSFAMTPFPHPAHQTGCARHNTSIVTRPRPPLGAEVGYSVLEIIPLTYLIDIRTPRQLTLSRIRYELSQPFVVPDDRAQTTHRPRVRVWRANQPARTAQSRSLSHRHPQARASIGQPPFFQRAQFSHADLVLGQTAAREKLPY